MSDYSISIANQDLTASLHGTNLNKINNLTALHNRTARQLLGDIDPQETIRKVITTTPIFNQVWDYACPVDLKGDRIIDISPQIYRVPGQVITQSYNQDFDIQKNWAFSPSSFTIQFNQGVKTIRINDNTLPQGAVLDELNALNNWTTGGTASNLQVDNVNWVANGGSLSFNLGTGSPNQTGYISETTPAPFDLTTQLNQATIFYYLYLPTPTAIVSTEVRWGSDSTDYYSVVNTSQFGGNAFTVGWNLIAANWLGATVVGTPNVANIQYLYIGVTYNGTLQTAVRVDNLVSTMGLYRNLEYYSKYLYQNSVTGAFQETTTSNSDLINLDTESYNLYAHLLAFFAVQQVQGLSGLFFDSNFFGQQYQQLKTRYTSINKSQVQKPRQSYYTPNKGGYGKYRNRSPN